MGIESKKKNKRFIKSIRQLIVKVFIYLCLILAGIFVAFGMALPMINDSNTIKLIGGIVTLIAVFGLEAYTLVNFYIDIKTWNSERKEEQNT